ncbi:MAG: MFS transporter [bacterium]
MTNHRQTTAVVAGIASFVVPFMSSAVTVASPCIGSEFSLSAAGLGWIVTAYLLATAASLLPAGRLADIVGKKEVFVAGMVLFSVSSFASAISPSYAILLASRIFGGVGAAMGFATGTAILMTVTPLPDRGRVLGWNVAAVYLGLSLGPPLGGLITRFLGWEWVFVAGGAAGLLATVMAALALEREHPAAADDSFDIAGTLAWGIALIAFMYGLTRLSGWYGVPLVVLGLICFGVFVRMESRLKSPLLEVEVFSRNPAFVFSNLAALINYSATMAVVFLLNLYLQFQRGLTASEAGMVLLIQPVVMAVVSPLTGRLSDRIPAGTLASAGMALTVVVLGAFAFLGPSTNMWFVRAGLAVLGLCFGLFSSPNMNAVMSSVERRRYGVASSTLGTMRTVGQVLSMGIATLIMTHYLGREEIGPGNVGGLMKSVKLAFAVSAVLCVFGVAASLARGGRKPEGRAA